VVEPLRSLDLEDWDDIDAVEATTRKVSHDRPGREPLPDSGSPGIVGRAHPDRTAVRPRSGRGKKGHGNTYAKRIAVLAAYAAANTHTLSRLSSARGAGAGGRRPAAPWSWLLRSRWTLSIPSRMQQKR
jgi:hypothetical protein